MCAFEGLGNLLLALEPAFGGRRDTAATFRGHRGRYAVDMVDQIPATTEVPPSAEKRQIFPWLRLSPTGSPQPSRKLGKRSEQAVAIQQIELDIGRCIQHDDAPAKIVAPFQLAHKILDHPARAPHKDQARNVRPAGAHHHLPQVQKIGWVFSHFDGADREHIVLFEKFVTVSDSEGGSCAGGDRSLPNGTRRTGTRSNAEPMRSRKQLLLNSDVVRTKSRR